MPCVILTSLPVFLGQVRRLQWHQAIWAVMKRGVWESASSMCRNTTFSNCWRTALSSCAPRGQTGQWLSSKSTLTDWKRWGVNVAVSSHKGVLYASCSALKSVTFVLDNMCCCLWFTHLFLTCCNCMLWAVSFDHLAWELHNSVLVDSPTLWILDNHLTSNWFCDRQIWYYIMHVKCRFRSWFFGTIRNDLDGLEIQNIYSTLLKYIYF